MSGSSEIDAGEAQLREQVKILGEKFLTRTAGQIVTLREQLVRLRQGERDALTSIQELTHKIHGSGAMFGFAALSERAGEIELLTEAAAGATGDLASEEADHLTRLIDQLAVAVEAARGKT